MVSMPKGDTSWFVNHTTLTWNIYQCLSSLQKHPYLLEEEETYEPPEDPDSGMSLDC